MKISKTLKTFVGFALVVALASGCVAFRGSDVPAQPRTKLTAPDGPVAASYQLEWFALGKPNQKRASEILEDAFVNEARNSGLFSSLSTTPAPYQLKVTVKNTGNIAAAVITGALSGLTLTLFPGYARDNFEMIVTVSKDNAVLKEYRLNDHVTTITQILMIFGMPFNHRGDAPKDVIKNMTWGILRQMAEDKILNAVPATAPVEPAAS